MNSRVSEGNLVMLRLDSKYGFTNTWWRVLFIDNDETFIGRLEKKHWLEYQEHNINDIERFDIERIIKKYQEGENFCYSDGITICECPGLCREK